jgi:hypothetical protein
MTAYIILFIFLILLCDGLLLRQKRYGDKTLRLFVVSNSSASRVSFFYYTYPNLYATDSLNYSRSIVARKYNDLEFLTSPRGCSLLDNTNCANNTVQLTERYNAIRNLTGIAHLVKAVGNQRMLRVGYLHNCAAPSVVHIDLQTYLDFTFQGQNSTAYAFDQDAVSDEDVVERFVRESDQMRILVRRIDFRVFKIQIGFLFGSTYAVQASSVANYTTFPPNLTNSSSTNVLFDDGSNITFIRKYTAVQLPDAEVLTEINFFKNKERPHLYRLKTANFEVGGLDANLQLKTPFCTNGAPCGGYIIFATGEFPHIPVAIPPNPLYRVYRDDCIHFYPKAETFLGWGFNDNNGGTYSRMIADQLRCMAPFYAPELIINSNGVEVQDERFRQCYMLGGELANQAQDVCTRPIAWAKCKENYIWFAGFCYYKFNAQKEPWARVIGTEAVTICKQLYEFAEPLPNANFDTEAWLRRHYLWIDRQADVRYSVPVFNENCDCYFLTENSTESVEKCNCNEANFPICRYAEKHYEVIDRHVSHSPLTIAVLRDGQQGSPWTGQEFKTQCYNGWTDEACDIPTCGYPVSVQTQNPVAIFFTACYANDRGRCENTDVRACLCFDNYAPDANMITSSQLIMDTPCACPASKQTNATQFLINNNTFLTDEDRFVVCSGHLKGRCVVDAFSNAGECACATRVRVSRDFTGEIENAFDGKACSCRVPKIFTGSNIRQALCNNRGYCCPFGESLTDGIDPFKCPKDYEDGCLCNNGWTGEACTCEAPFNLAKITAITSPTQIKIIVLDRDDAGAVILQNQCYKTGFNNKTYYCGENTFLVNPLVANATIVEMYADWFPPCGNNTNPFAGRFSATAQNRNFRDYRELQPIHYTQHGCTNSQCMCDPEHTGILAISGSSALPSE